MVSDWVKVAKLAGEHGIRYQTNAGLGAFLAALRAAGHRIVGPADMEAVVAWQATTVFYKQFITDAQYQKFSPEVRSWYKPYRCSSCSTASPHMPVVLMPEGGPVELDDCPEGLFLFGDTLAVMTEYATVSAASASPMRQRDAYIVESGEYFWGGTSRTVDRAKLMVQPLASLRPGGA